MANWRNRIVGQADVQPDQLLAHPLNYRIHPVAQQAALEGSLDELGWFKRILVQAGTDMVIDGHARIALAMRRGEPTVPVDYVDLSDDEARLALLTGDHIMAMAVVDRAKLDELLRDVGTGEPGLQDAIAGLAEANGLYLDPGSEEDDSAGADAAPEAEEPKPVTREQPGVMVICGDDVEQERVFERLQADGYECRKATVTFVDES